MSFFRTVVNKTGEVQKKPLKKGRSQKREGGVHKGDGQKEC